MRRKRKKNRRNSKMIMAKDFPKLIMDNKSKSKMLKEHLKTTKKITPKPQTWLYYVCTVENQRITRREKALSEQCRKIEENLMERLVVSSRKLDAKGTFHAMMDAVKDRRKRTQQFK